MSGTVTVVKDETKRMLETIKGLTAMSVVVGVTAQTSPRPGGPINNAELAYIHDNGSPINNIPQREFMRPGIDDAKDKIIRILKIAGEKTMELGTSHEPIHEPDVTKDRGPSLTGSSLNERKAYFSEKAFNEVGMVAVSAIKNRIVAGIPPGLKEGTLKARARRAGQKTGLSIAKGALAELAYREANHDAGLSMTATTPLVDSSSMLHSITYEVRKR